MKYILLLMALHSLPAFAAKLSPLCKDFAANQLSYSDVPQLQTDELNLNSITLLTWNVHKHESAENFFAVKRLSKAADLIFLQETLHSDDWQAAFASQILWDFSFFKSFCNRHNLATGVMTISKFNLDNNLTIISPGVEPIIFTHKVAGYSTIQLSGTKVHLINTHALNFNTGFLFEQQMIQLAQFVAQLSGPLIWAGDFNTWNRSRKIFIRKLIQKLKLTEMQPQSDFRHLIVDHIYVRGFENIQTEVLNEKSSDHFPLRSQLRLKY
ncbi:MAG: endonuclease/exonuclease/phosphatase family protein [Bdellovibrionaceae bacterium]|nr:endonuclease/exonuclease/phosphatase family protein [Bdellovibrio sp.]